jgi:protein-tyrosine phosphatase
MIKHVLFLCIFNVKRSVVAQHMLRRMLRHAHGDDAAEIEVGSAGFLGPEISQWFTTHNIPYPEPLFNRTPSELIQSVMAERGFDLSAHRSRPVNRKILNRSSLIIPLLIPLKTDLIRVYPEMEKKIVLPRELMENDASFLWEDTTAVPNDKNMFDFAHNNEAYVNKVINEIEGFLQDSFHQIRRRLL